MYDDDSLCKRGKQRVERFNEFILLVYMQIWKCFLRTFLCLPIRQTCDNSATKTRLPTAN